MQPDELLFIAFAAAVVAVLALALRPGRVSGWRDDLARLTVPGGMAMVIATVWAVVRGQAVTLDGVVIALVLGLALVATGYRYERARPASPASALPAD